MADGTFRIDTRFDTTGAQKGVDSLTSSLKKLGGVIASVFAVGAIIKFGKEAIGLASDLVEVDNVVSKAFGNMRGEMDALADTAITQLGMSRLTAYQTGSTFMSMGRSMLDSAEDAKVMALELTKLTGNMSSFFNVSQDLASIALKSIYTGETETLKQYGVVMTETNLKEFARAQGIKKAYSEMTQSEKVMLRYQYVMNQLSFIGDDFIDTQDSWANQTRILKEQWKEFMSVIGSTLISVLTPAIKVLNQVVSSLISATKAIQSALSSVFGIQIQQMSDATQSTVGATSAMEDYGDAVQEAGKKAKKNLASFDELQTLQKDEGSSGSSGGGSYGGLSSVDFGGVAEDAEKISFPWLDGLLEKLQPLIDAFGELKGALEELGGITLDGLAWIYDNILVPLGNWILQQALPVAIEAISKAIRIVSGVIQELQPYLLLIWNNVLQPIASWLGKILLDVISGVMNVLFQLWNDVLQPLIQWVTATIMPVLEPIFETIKESINAVFYVIDTVINSVFEILGGIITFLQGVFTGDINLVLEGIKRAFSSAWSAITNIVKTAVNLIFTVISKIFQTILSTISTVLKTIVTVIKVALNVIFTNWNEIFTKLKEIVEGVFQGIWDFIKNIINSILGGIESMANGVVNGVNAVINALNSLQFEIPDWIPALGGKTFGFNINTLSQVQIPRLATGAVLPANNPFLAVVGDQKSGTNVEAPLDTIKQALIEAMGSMNGGNGDVYISADGDLNALVRLLNLKITNENNRVGKSFVKAGSV